MARRASEGFPQRFRWVLGDLRALASPRPLLAEGWGLRPEPVGRVVDDVARMAVLVPPRSSMRHSDGSCDAQSIADIAEGRFARFL